jgi:RNA polymerase sigma-70 factor (ECF subfamily)
MAVGVAFQETLAAARTGTEWAVAVLYREFQPALLGYLTFHEPREAEDLAAEVWRCVGEGLSRFEGTEEGLRGWIFTIARRRMIDWRRKQAGRRTQPTSNETFAALPSHDDPANDAVSAVGESEAAARVRALLPPDQAEVVILRVMAGLDAHQVGELMDKSPGAVRVLQHRALRRLAAHLSPEGVTA